MIEGAKEMQELIDFHRSMTFEEERAWAYSKKNEWDLFAITTTAEEKGLIKGIAKGRAEGRAEVTAQNAKRMKAKGYPIEDIADITGLTIEEIEQL